MGKFYILARARSFAEVYADQAALWNVIDRWHLTIGATILETWEVAEEIRNAVLEHRDLERTHRGPADITDVVVAANILDAHHHIDREPLIHWDSLPPALVLLGLNKEAGDALMVDAKEELDLIFQALS